MNLKHYTWLGLLLAQSATGAESPRWSLEIKGGQFQSTEEAWSDFYGDDRYSAYAMALGYKLHRQIEVGIETGYQEDEGQGFAPGHGTLSGDVKYRLYPLHLHLTARGVFHPDQWLVPYVGIAWSRFNYRVETEGQSDSSGSTDGYQYRAGLQLLLDNLERSAAATLESSFGVVNTYLFIEAQRTEASLEGVELGGTAYYGGLLFEF